MGPSWRSGETGTDPEINQEGWLAWFSSKYSYCEHYHGIVANLKI